MGDREADGDGCSGDAAWNIEVDATSWDAFSGGVYLGGGVRVAEPVAPSSVSKTGALILRLIANLHESLLLLPDVNLSRERPLLS